MHDLRVGDGFLTGKRHRICTLVHSKNFCATGASHIDHAAMDAATFFSANVHHTSSIADRRADAFFDAQNRSRTRGRIGAPGVNAFASETQRPLLPASLMR